MTAKSKISCLLLAVLLAWYAVVYILVSWLVCQCGEWEFRWIYPLTAFLVIEILKGLFKGHHSGETMKNLLDGIDDKLKEKERNRGNATKPGCWNEIFEKGRNTKLVYGISGLAQTLHQSPEWIKNWLDNHNIPCDAVQPGDGYAEDGYPMTMEQYRELEKDAASATEDALDGHPFTASELSEKLKKDVPWVVDWLFDHKIKAMQNNDGIEASYLEPQYMLTDEEYAKISKDAEE